jgi:hypothetical protein
MKMPKHIIDGSSSISHIDWHDEDDTLEVCFTSGGTYHYPRCDKKHYHALKNAVSAGKYFHENIRSQYQGHKINFKK